VLDADLVVRADDRPLEQRPHAFNTVCVNVATDPLFSPVIDTVVFGVRVRDPEISRVLVGIDLGRIGGCLFGDEVMECLAVGFLSQSFNAKPNSARFAAFERPENHRLVVEVPATNVPTFSADPSFIGFNRSPVSAQLFGFIFAQAHSLANAMAKIPSRLVAYAQRAFDLVRGHALLGLAHQVDGKEPLPKRQVGVMKYRLSSDAEMVFASLERASVLEATSDLPGLSAATKALNALRPTNVLKRLAASVVSSERRYQIDQIHVRFN